MPTHPEIPRHIAVIMDGNGRWAKERGLPRLEGHRAGADSVREVLEACIEMGVQYLTLYAFSSENWSRPASEVKSLMGLLDRFLVEKAKDFKKQKVRLLAIGQLERLPDKTRGRLEKIQEQTKDYQALTLILALSYGGREEIVAAAQKIAIDVQNGTLEADRIDNSLFASYLQTAGMPDPDLLIRTSGEMRVSNFLLWQISYAEMVVVPKYWPEFRKPDLVEAVGEYKRRNRRFGGL